MTRRISLLAVAPVAVALVLAGCGGSSSSGTSTSNHTNASSTTSGGQVLTLSADPGGQLRFDKSNLEARPGKVTLKMTNPTSAGMDHAIAVKGNGVDSDGQSVAPGGTSTVTVTLKKGTYEFFCPVPGHEQAGMKGTLTVQ